MARAKTANRVVIAYGALVLAVLASGAFSGCDLTKRVAAPQTGVNDQSSAHTFGFLPVHNYLPATQGASLTEGQQYVYDLANNMIYYAMIECMPTGTVAASTWFATVSNFSSMDYLYVNAQRQVVTPDANNVPNQPTPCRVVNNHLLTYPMMTAALNAPYKGSTSPGAYRLAQSVYLSLNGSYVPGNGGANLHRVSYMHFARMLQAQAGLPLVNGDLFVADLDKVQGDFNPCVATGGKLPAAVRALKSSNYACVQTSTGFAFVAGGGTQPYETVRDSVGHEVDALYDQIYGQPSTSAALTTVSDPDTARDLAMRSILDATNAIAQPGALFAANYGTSYQNASMASNRSALALTSATTLRDYPSLPGASSIAAMPPLASGGATTGLALLRTNPTRPTTNPTTNPTTRPTNPTANTAATARPGLTNLQHLLNQQTSVTGAGNPNTNNGQVINANLAYASQSQLGTLKALSSGQVPPGFNAPTQTGGGLFTTATNNSGQQVSVNNQTGAAYVYQSGGTIQGVGGNPSATTTGTIIENFPHTSGANGQTLGGDYAAGTSATICAQCVGSYFKSNGSGSPDLVVHTGEGEGGTTASRAESSGAPNPGATSGTASTGVSDISFHTQADAAGNLSIVCPNGTSQAAKDNAQSFSNLNTAIANASSPAQRQALAQTLQSYQNLTHCGSSLMLAGRVGLLDGEDGGGGGGDCNTGFTYNQDTGEFSVTTNDENGDQVKINYDADGNEVSREPVSSDTTTNNAATAVASNNSTDSSTNPPTAATSSDQTDTNTDQTAVASNTQTAPQTGDDDDDDYAPPTSTVVADNSSQDPTNQDPTYQDPTYQDPTDPDQTQYSLTTASMPAKGTNGNTVLAKSPNPFVFPQYQGATLKHTYNSSPAEKAMANQAEMDMRLALTN